MKHNGQLSIIKLKNKKKFWIQCADLKIMQILIIFYIHEKWCRQDFSYKKNKKNKNKIIYTMLWKL